MAIKFLPSFRRAEVKKGEQKFHGGASIMGVREAHYPSPNFINHTEQAYARNELVFACITEKATSAPEAPFRVHREVDEQPEPDEDHPLRRLIRKPNPVMSEFELWELTVVHLEIAGNAFWWIVRDRLGRVAEIWPIRPDMVRVFPSTARGAQQRRIHHTYGIQYDYTANPVSVGQDIVQFKYPNPINEFLGMPPLRAALRAVALDNEATDFVKGMLENDAMPATLIRPAAEVDRAVAERLKNEWRTAYGGENRGGPGVLQAGMEVEQLGLSLRDLEFPDLRTISETRICMAFRVPPILVGAKSGLERSTFSNTAEARKSFWEQTIMPLQRRLADTVALKLAPEYSGVHSVGFDNSDVVALREVEKERWDRATAAFRAGGITRNQFLREIGLPEIGTPGDVFMTPAGVLPIPITEAHVPVFPAPGSRRDRDQLEEEAAALAVLRMKALNGH